MGLEGGGLCKGILVGKGARDLCPGSLGKGGVVGEGAGEMLLVRKMPRWWGFTWAIESKIGGLRTSVINEDSPLKVARDTSCCGSKGR